MNIIRFLVLTTVLVLPYIVQADKAPGRIHVKVAVLNYEPILENRDGLPYWQACNWTDPRQFIDQIVEGVRLASDNMVILDVVHWTNIDLYPVGTSKGRFLTDEIYWDGYANGWSQAGITDDKMGVRGYMMAITNDFAHIPAMIERGEIDHCIMFGGPYFGYWETTMFGKGAYHCNSGPNPLATERLFTINGPNVERPGNTLHNYAHGFGENMLGEWFFNGIISTTGSDRYRNSAAAVNDFIKFTRSRNATNEFFQEIHCGTCHTPPNGDIDYDYSNPAPVMSYASSWLDFPDNIDAPPERTSMIAWGGGDGKYQTWWWNHIPRTLGFRRGRINNWLTMVWNQMKASYPVGSDQPLNMNDLDLRGWYAYEFYAPPGTTQMTIYAETEVPVTFGLRKDYVPMRYRSGTSGGYDDWSDAWTTNYSQTITPNHNFGKNVEGFWYLTFGKRLNTSWDTNQYRAQVKVSILPKPVSNNVKLEITAPQKNQELFFDQSITNIISWNISGVTQGVRSYQIDYQLTNAVSQWLPICADYHYQLKSPYVWFGPQNQESSQARIRIIAEDVYGISYTNYSKEFNLNVPEPSMFSVLLAFFRHLFIK